MTHCPRCKADVEPITEIDAATREAFSSCAKCGMGLMLDEPTTDPVIAALVDRRTIPAAKREPPDPIELLRARHEYVTERIAELRKYEGEARVLRRMMAACSADDDHENAEHAPH